jgi:hypothetical protein
LQTSSAAYALDPEFVSDGLLDAEITEGLLTMLERLSTNAAEAQQAAEELLIFRQGRGLFSQPSAIGAAKTMSGADFWAMYGSSAKTLQPFAIKILSAVPSACACERNWSSFGFIQSQLRNKLRPENAKELVEVYCNRRLKKKIQLLNGKPAFVPWEQRQSSSEDEPASSDEEGSITVDVSSEEDSVSRQAGGVHGPCGAYGPARPAPHPRSNAAAPAGGREGRPNGKGPAATQGPREDEQRRTRSGRMFS